MIGIRLANTSDVEVNKKITKGLPLGIPVDLFSETQK